MSDRAGHQGSVTAPRNRSYWHSTRILTFVITEPAGWAAQACGQPELQPELSMCQLDNIERTQMGHIFEYWNSWNSRQATKLVGV